MGPEHAYLTTSLLVVRLLLMVHPCWAHEAAGATPSWALPSPVGAPVLVFLSHVERLHSCQLPALSVLGWLQGCHCPRASLPVCPIFGLSLVTRPEFQLWIHPSDPPVAPESRDQTGFQNPDVPSPCPFPVGADVGPVSLGFKHLHSLEHARGRSSGSTSSPPSNCTFQEAQGATARRTLVLE